MIGYWLLPTEFARGAFAALISDLAEKYGGPVFEPHITLYASDNDETHARAVVAEVGEQTAPIEMRAESVEQSNEFTRTLFVQFAQNPAAQQVSDAIRARSLAPHSYAFNPHLSLLYADLRGANLTGEAERIPKLFGQIGFDAIAAVVFPTAIKTRADVEAWRTIATAKLAG